MKIKKIILKTHLLQDLRDFYIKILQLGIGEEREGQYFSCIIGESELGFEQIPEGSLDRPNYHFAFNIPENQLEEGIIFLENQGIDLIKYKGQYSVDFSNWNAHAAYFLDPAGNILELIARHDLANAREQSFASESLLSISEIAFPVPSVQTFYESLNTQVSIPMYSSISNLKSFCAAGNPEGLFIIVPLERPWFPTQIMNGLYPIRAWIEAPSDFLWQVEGLPYELRGLKQ